jgi:peptidoglycan/xylan/chitin deacetylase (PgdA/CDA1 family)
MYHDVPARAPFDRFAVPNHRFVAHLDVLDALRLRVVPVEEAAPGRVGLTFDDGYAAHYAEVFPLLVARGMRATFFVTTGWVGKRGFVTWEQLREMAAAGMSIQSHTANHPLLSESSHADVVRELVTSRERIEAEIGQPCGAVALPGGAAPREWRANDYAQLGFGLVATSRWGANSGRPTRAAAKYVRRYTVRYRTPDAWLPRFALGRSTRLHPESLRLFTLGMVRTVLGGARYQRLRRRVLGTQAELLIEPPALRSTGRP